jgi:hypothetical protein
MKNSFYTAIFIFFALLVSCKNDADSKEQKQQDILPVTSVPATTNNPTSINAVLPSSLNNSQPLLNPEHGKPGHRCDIAVGAPLTDAPANKASQITTTPNLPVSNVNPVTTATAVAPGMNPQHGQPGHRCDIAVGAPLNSAPAKNNTSQAIQLPSLPASNVNPGTTTTAVAPGMNPQHGQPGHRCDIAVGAPLDSKPKQ